MVPCPGKLHAPDILAASDSVNQSLLSASSAGGMYFSVCVLCFHQDLLPENCLVKSSCCTPDTYTALSVHYLNKTGTKLPFLSDLNVLTCTIGTVRNTLGLMGVRRVSNMNGKCPARYYHRVATGHLLKLHMTKHVPVFISCDTAGSSQ